MKLRMPALMAALTMVVMFAGGCANKDVIKTEEPVVKPDASASDSSRTTPQQPYTKTDESSRVVPATSSQDQEQSVTDLASGLAAIYFDYDKSDLSSEARETLNKNAQTLLKSKSGVKIKVEGHCDERGSAEYNLALGERRAKSALQYLLTLGVQPDRLTVISYGKEKPAVKGSDEAAWSKNRRAEFVVAR